MSQSKPDFPPTRRAALTRLARFVPTAGADYAKGRNYDSGTLHNNHVSTLSPYLRVRCIDELTVTKAVLKAHTESQAAKFLTEVFWRIYWKGWMELRPGVWDQYHHDIKRLSVDLEVQSGLRERWEAACLGRTGIAPFDHWAQELATTGYLHNHARMWFASIWIFTLGLPWQLGADFFLRHLFDGDAAVNTLSWRWVAGIQTRGKTYLARPDNIVKYTAGRFNGPLDLAKTAHALAAPHPPAPRVLPKIQTLPARGRYAILLHEDDVGTDLLHTHAPAPVIWGYLEATAGHSPLQMSPAARAFRKQIAQDVIPAGVSLAGLSCAKALRDWAVQNNLDQIVTAYAPVGPTQKMLAAYAALDKAVPLNVLQRPLDRAGWPLATKGFFAFRKHIPALIDEFVRGQGKLALSPVP